MKVEFERSGGFGGLNMSKSIDSGDLRPEDSKKLEDLIKNSNFFSLPEEISSPRIGADRFQYRITVEDENSGEKHTVDVDEAAVPPTVKPLIQWLDERPQKK
jgi:hypothetical protein